MRRRICFIATMSRGVALPVAIFAMRRSQVSDFLRVAADIFFRGESFWTNVDDTAGSPIGSDRCFSMDVRSIFLEAFPPSASRSCQATEKRVPSDVPPNDEVISRFRFR